MIELQCENCGKHVRAPDDAAGKQGKCPGCGRSIYIPSPDDIAELPLADESTEDLRREAALLEESRRLARNLAREDRLPPETGPGNARPAGREVTGGSRIPPTDATSPSLDLEAAIVDYLTAMRDSDFERAHEAVAALRHNRTEARQIVDRLAADQIPPAQMTRVPAPVYQGFLKNLRTQLG